MVLKVTPAPTDGECDVTVARVTESEGSGEWQTSQDIQTTQPHFEVQYEGIPCLCYYNVTITLYAQVLCLESLRAFCVY